MLKGYDFWVEQPLQTRNMILDYLRHSDRSEEADALLRAKGKADSQAIRDAFFGKKQPT